MKDISTDIILVYPQKNTALFGVPLGIAYIGAALRADGYNVQVIDMRYRNEETLFDALQHTRPMIVGFYVSSEITPSVLELAQSIKRQHPSVTIIAGGPHATIDPESLLKGAVDVVVRGEGERTIRKLLPAIQAEGTLSEIDGISYCDGQRIAHNPPAAFIENLDDLPLPAYDLFPDIDKTLATSLAWPVHLPFTHVLVSRGCPFQCSFCQPTLDKMFGKQMRRLSPRRTMELLTYLKTQYHVKEVFFEDDLLLSKSWKPWLIELTNLMRSENLNLRWWGQARANSADREILSMAKAAGCYMVMCGIESGCQKTLDFYKKNISVADIRSFFAMCNDLGLMTVAEIIFGAPGESPEDAEETIALMRALTPDMIWVSILTPYPGTYLVDWLSENNVAYEKNLAKIDRGIRKQRIDSLMTETQLLHAVAYLTQAHISWKRFAESSSYRKAYRDKLRNLLACKLYLDFAKLLIWPLVRPILKPLQIMYYRHESSRAGHFIKRILSKMRP